VASYVNSDWANLSNVEPDPLEDGTKLTEVDLGNRNSESVKDLGELAQPSEDLDLDAPAFYGTKQVRFQCIDATVAK
jgi:hypothetical protein